MSLGKTLLAQTLALDFKDGCKRYDTMGDGIIKLPRYILDGHMLDEHIFFKKWAVRGLFSFIFVFSNKHYKFTKNICDKMSIRYTVLGFELTTSS